MEIADSFSYLKLKLVPIVLLAGFFTTNAFASTKIGEYTDASGKITVAVFENVASSAQEVFSNFAVDVPDPYVVIGGGVEGSESPQGNLLTASYPNSGLTAWLVSTKDHMYADAIYVKAWAIGIKIAGLTRAQTLSLVSVTTASSSYVNHPDISVAVPTDSVMIGGGFKVNWSGSGNLATASYPQAADTWRAQSKDHLSASPATLQVYAIGLPQYIAGVGTISVITNFSDSTYAEHPTSYADLTSDYAITGCGALLFYDSPGSLLWKIKPAISGGQYGCTTASKDHAAYALANIRTFVTGIKVN